MASDTLIRMAEQCSVVRRCIGSVLMTPEGTPERAAAEDAYRAAVRDLLREVRAEEFSLLLEAAGELA